MERRVRFILELDEREAKWLRTVMQNPIIESESPEDEQMRKKLFDALTLIPSLPTLETSLTEKI